MADFHQSSVIATMHRLGRPNLDRIEKDLVQFTRKNPVALVLPSLFSELQRDALPGILTELKEASYINEVVVSLDRASEDDYRYAKEFFSVLPQKTTVIWNDGPKIQDLLKLLVKNEVEIGKTGKGRSCWMAYGYILARGTCNVIAQHDCDILNYTRQILARLVYPIVAPSLQYEYCKGYYPRLTDRLHGRVTRLFVTPLIRSLEKILGPTPILTYLDSFRYPLAGEFAMVTSLAQINRIPGDWGLEIGTLSETYRNCALRRICQSDLCDQYDHKHQDLSADDPESGLMKMSMDIAKSLFRNLAIEGVILDVGILKTLAVTYQRMAQDTIQKYEADSAINSLYFDRHQEGISVAAFTQAIKLAGEEYLEDPVGIPMISNWIRPTSAIPNFFQLLVEAVQEDNR